jgi:hypothetical protein
MELTDEEINIVRQWYNAVYDLNREYLNPSDVILYVKIVNHLDK